MLEYLHLQSRTLVQSITLPEGAKQVTLDIQQWQELLGPAGAAGRVSAQDRRAGSGVSPAAFYRLREAVEWPLRHLGFTTETQRSRRIQRDDDMESLRMQFVASDLSILLS